MKTIDDDINIPKCIKFIKSSAFYNYENLKQMTIPNSVTSKQSVV